MDEETKALIERLRALHVWPQSVADTYADTLTPRQIKQLYEVGFVAHEAADALEAHDAFRQEVSDAVEKLLAWPSIRSQGIIVDSVARFIIAKPDPLVEVIAELSPWNTSNRWNNDDFSDRLRAALAKRGLEIRETKHD